MDAKAKSAVSLSLLALIATLVVALTAAPAAAHAEDKDLLSTGNAPSASAFDYNGDNVNVINRAGESFTPFTPMRDTTVTFEGDNVVINYVVGDYVYHSFYLEADVNDQSTWDENKHYKLSIESAYSLTLPKSYCGKAWPIVPLRTTGTPPDAQVYLAIPAAPVELGITNNSDTFKAATASAAVKPNGSATLTFAPAETDYHYLFRGTYEQAVANGANTDNWIAGHQNAAGKWEFQIPLAANELGADVPIVSISDTYYQQYLNGEGPLERSFDPRQFNLDLGRAMLTVGDYEATKSIAVTNNVSPFEPATSATLECMGGPNSSNYKADLVLPMQNADMSNVFVGGYDDAVAASETIALDPEGNTFTIPVKWVEVSGDPMSVVNHANGEPFFMSFKSASDGKWNEYKATLSEDAGTLVLDPSAADYTAVDKAKVTAAAIERDKYTSESLADLDAAVAAVVTGKFGSQQAEVDAMAKAINDAIAKLKVNIAKAKVTAPNQAYNGAAKKPAATVVLDGATLKAGTDYTLAYKNNVNAGTATVAVTGIGSYAGSASGAFKINPTSIAKATVAGIVGKNYTGKALTQAPVVKLGGKTLKNGTDYKLSYKNNTKVGTATMTITGKGNYTGSKPATFQIKGWVRLFGSSAFDTMAKITQEYGKAATAIVATNADFKDSLAGAALAGGYNAPMLTTTKAGLADKTKSELKRMGVKTVYLVGSTNEVAKKTEDQIKAMGITVKRVSAATPSERAVAAAKQVKGRSDTVVIATQASFKDALAASPYAYASKSPILYAEANKKLSNATLAYIKSAGFKKAVVVGGPIAMPKSIESQLSGAGIKAANITRLAGSNQYRTAQVVAEWATGKLKNGTGGSGLYQYASIKFQPVVRLTANKLGVARADDNRIGWKDALAGAALCGKNKSVLLLADKVNSAQAAAFVKANKAQIQYGYVFGGTSAVPKAVMDKLVSASL